jgi:hypothetical protein
LDYIVNPLPGLLGPVSIKLDAVAKHLSSPCNGLERHAIANTRVDCGQWSIWKPEESANPLGFGQWKGLESESTFALKAQGCATF